MYSDFNEASPGICNEIWQEIQKFADLVQLKEKIDLKVILVKKEERYRALTFKFYFKGKGQRCVILKKIK